LKTVCGSQYGTQGNTTLKTINSKQFQYFATRRPPDVNSGKELFLPVSLLVPKKKNFTVCMLCVCVWLRGCVGVCVVYVRLVAGLLTRSDHSQRELTRMLNITTLPRRHYDPCLFGVRFVFWSARFTHLSLTLTHQYPQAAERYFLPPHPHL